MLGRIATRLRTSPAARATALALLLAGCAVAPYAHTINYGFLNYDDGSTIIDLPLIRQLSWSALPRFFAPDRYALLPEYMPLKNLSYALDYALFGLSASGFRLQQYAWYIASIFSVWFWLSTLLVRLSELGRLDRLAPHARALAWVTSLLFALHPAHVEAVTWLSSRKDVLCGAFMPAALACDLRYSVALTQGTGRSLRWASVTLLCAALALLSKPAAIVLLPLVLLQEWWISPPQTAVWKQLRERAVVLMLLAALQLAFMSIYLHVVADLARDEISALRFHGPGALRWGQQLWLYLVIGLAPNELLPIYPPALLDEHWLSISALRGFATALALAACFAWGATKRNLPGFAVGLFVVALLPSVLRPVWGQYVAARYAYLSVLGVSLGLCWMMFRLWVARGPHVGLAAICGLALLWGALSTAYSTVWRSSDALWAYAADVYPRFARFYDLGARAALSRGDAPAALHILTRCVDYNPTASECLAPLGGLMLLRDPARGEELLRRALPGDGSGIAHMRLARYWASRGRSRAALQFYADWLKHRQPGPQAIDVLIDLALDAGEPETARKYLPRLVRAAAIGSPASPPPSATALRVLEQTREPEMLARARHAAVSCRRSDCFATALGW